MTLYFAGIDIGSTMTKAVIIGVPDGPALTLRTFDIVASLIGPTGPEHRRLANKVMADALSLAGIPFENLSYLIATGYGRINVPFADRQITEITCHAKGIYSLFSQAKTIVDIGGQDSKGIKIKGGKVTGFVMNDKCAAGTGRFLEIMADALGIPLERLGEISLSAEKPASVSSTCTVFAEHEVISRLAGGETRENLVAGIHEAIAIRVYSLIAKLKIEPDIVITGGGAKNPGLVKALSTKFSFPLLVPPEPLITGALGAAVMGKELYDKYAEQGTALPRDVKKLEEATFFS